MNYKDYHDKKQKINKEILQIVLIIILSLIVGFFIK